jgi:hypothetical protein
MARLEKVPAHVLAVAVGLALAVAGCKPSTPTNQTQPAELAGVFHKGEKTIMPYLVLDGSQQQCYVIGAPLAAYESGAHIHVKGVLLSRSSDLPEPGQTPDEPAPPPFRKGCWVYMDVKEAGAVEGAVPTIPR